jgi:hypothetical protein
MGSLALLRGISDAVACLAVRPGSGSHQTARWQDKSREARCGRAAEECRHISHLARGATARDSLPIRATRWHFATIRTSRAPTP